MLSDLFQQCPESDELLDDHGRHFLHLAVEEKRVDVVQWVCKKMKHEHASASGSES